jgi:hypothetical protein
VVCHHDFSFIQYLCQSLAFSSASLIQEQNNSVMATEYNNNNNNNNKKKRKKRSKCTNETPQSSAYSAVCYFDKRAKAFMLEGKKMKGVHPFLSKRVFGPWVRIKKTKAYGSSTDKKKGPRTKVGALGVGIKTDREFGLLAKHNATCQHKQQHKCFEQPMVKRGKRLIRLSEYTRNAASILLRHGYEVVKSQVPVGSSAIGLATAVDLLCRHIHTNHYAIVELKTNTDYFHNKTVDIQGTHNIIIKGQKLNNSVFHRSCFQATLSAMLYSAYRQKMPVLNLPLVHTVIVLRATKCMAELYEIPDEELAAMKRALDKQLALPLTTQ